MSTVSLGKALEKEAEAILLKQGYIVERAYNKTIWLAAGRVISVAHDFFSIWDLIGKRFGEPTLWVQVTVIEEASKRIRKILDSNYQWNSDHDEPVIFARVRGRRNPHFRVLYGKDNYEWTGKVEMVLPKNKKPKEAVLEERSGQETAPL